MRTLLAAILAATAPAADPPIVAIGELPQLTAPQSAALRCGVAFAQGAKLQAERAPAASGWPLLNVRGKEYFVRVFAKLLDDTGDREGLTALATQEAWGFREDGKLAAAMPACLVLLDASGS